jgi:O-antigen ligase
MSIAERIDAIIRFFLYFMIFALPYSSAVVEICVGISTFLWLIKRGVLFYSQRNIKFRERLKSFFPKTNILNVPIGCFMIVCLLSVAGSLYIQNSFLHFFSKIFEWFVIFFLVLEVFTEKKHFQTALIVFLFTGISTVLDSLFQFYISHKDIFNKRVIIPGDRATAGFKTPNDLGTYLTCLVPLTVSVFFMIKKNRIWAVAVGLVFLFSLWSLYVVDSRGSWLGVFVGLALFFILNNWSWIRNQKILTGMFLIFCLFFLSQKFMHERSETVGWRFSIWNDSMKMIQDRPIFGHGINTFMSVFQEYNETAKANPTYAHNSVLQMAAETGIAGVFLFLFIIGKLFYAGIKQALNTTDRWVSFLMLGLFSSATAFFIQALSDTSFESLQLSALFWLVAGMIIAMDNLFESITKYDIKRTQIL